MSRHGPEPKRFVGDPASLACGDPASLACDSIHVIIATIKLSKQYELDTQATILPRFNMFVYSMPLHLILGDLDNSLLAPIVTSV